MTRSVTKCELIEVGEDQALLAVEARSRDGGHTTARANIEAFLCEELDEHRREFWFRLNQPQPNWILHPGAIVGGCHGSNKV